MATGVKPRDDETMLSRTELEYIQEAMKTKKFRDMLVDYCEEIRDPANQALYQKEMTQLEKERGYDVTFINPKGGYVIKTSVAGDRKAFINICTNEMVEKPSCDVQVIDGKRGLNWKIPYSLIPPREDYNAKRERCVIYDVVYHPDTLRMAERNKHFRDLVNKTALDALQENYQIHLDSNNCKFPKSAYKGMAIPAVIRKEDPDYKPHTDDGDDDEKILPPDMMEKLYPQRSYTETNANTGPKNRKDTNTAKTNVQPQNPVQSSEQPHRKRVKNSNEYAHNSMNGYTTPKYVIKQQKDVDFQDFTYHKDSKKYTAIPSQIVVEINLPLLSSTKDCTLDVQEKQLSLKSEKPAKYKLDINLPYPVNDQCGNAKFDKSKRKLIVTLPVIRNTIDNDMKCLKIDSGVESEGAGSNSDDETKYKLIEELSPTIKKDTVVDNVSPALEETDPKENMFLEPSLGYILPPYTHNVLDDTVAFTFHVKNTEPDSVKVQTLDNKVQVKFTSMGSSYVPIHYAAIIKMDNLQHADNINAEAWDNNVILQLEGFAETPKNFQIGLDETSMVTEEFDETVVHVVKEENPKEIQEETAPVVAVQNLGTETNIVVSSQDKELEDEDDDYSAEGKEIHWVGIENYSGAKSILRKSLGRSYSESSVGDVASSMDYVSSDCIPEESSLKKTVRFRDVITKQFYRHNSSIEGQKKKNQRKKSKKRNQERRKSQSDAEDDTQFIEKTIKPCLKSALKQRRDSGLADTSDAETTPNSSPTDEQHSILNIANGKGNTGAKETSKPAIWKAEGSPKKGGAEKEACDNIKHNTNLYDPDKLNKGYYTEVQFKNDLIFDLDM